MLPLFLLLISCQQQSTHSKVDAPVQQSLSASRLSDTSATDQLLAIWEGYDFEDEVRITDPDDSEQKVVDFIAIFPKYPLDAVQRAIQNVLSRAEINKNVFDYFSAQFAHYLYEPNSPMRSDLYYESVLAYLIRSKWTSNTDTQRYQMQLAMVQKNQVGSPINDFSYRTASGMQMKFSAAESDWRLLLFYDPTCTHCAAIISQLKIGDKLNELIHLKKLQVLAIDPLSDRSSWEKYKKNIPQNWENGLDSEKIITKNQLFSLRAYPTIYLVNKLGIVVLKDCDVDALEHYLLQL